MVSASIPSGMLAGLAQEAAAAGFEPILPAWIVLVPLAGFVVNAAVAYLWPERRSIVSIVGPGVIGVAFALTLVNFIGLLGAGAEGAIVRSYWSWIEVGGLRVEAALQIDPLSVLMALVVTGVSFVIHVYSIGYMGGDPGYARYFAYLNLFVFFMLVLVMGANLPVTFVGWEGVGLCSYLLIGFWFTDPAKSAAGQKAFIVNRIGDFGFLVGMFILFAYVGTLDYVQSLEYAPRAFEYGDPAITLATLFLFLGCVGKSAQIPLYMWLPDAMHGPTPVSALIHAATMVTAGVYLVARTSLLFAMAPLAMGVVAAIGLATAFFAATVALQQFDIKRVIAWSTISQLGYMFLAVGVGAFTAGIFHLATHAFFKALLFLASGAVIHSMHHALQHAGLPAGEDISQDMRNMGGLRRALPVTYWTAWAGALALAGVFPFAGFFSKDEILWATGSHGYVVFWAIGLVASLLTAAYIARWMVMVFHGENRTPGGARGHLHEAAGVMTVPLVILAVGAVVSGWINIPDALPALPAFTWLHDFLHPVFAGAEAMLVAHRGEPAHTGPLGLGEGTLALISTGLAALVVAVVFRALSRRRYVPAAESPEPSGLRRALYRAWYVEDLVDRAIVRPFQSLARFSWRVVDQGVIDGALVNGTAYASRFTGWVISRFQTGSVGAYVFVIVLGILVILGSVTW